MNRVIHWNKNLKNVEQPSYDLKKFLFLSWETVFVKLTIKLSVKVNFWPYN